jgi:hypothetical protein
LARKGGSVEKKKGYRKWLRRIWEKIYFVRWVKESKLLAKQERDGAALLIGSNLRRLRMAHMIRNVLPVIVCLHSHKGMRFRVQTKIWKKNRAVRWIKVWNTPSNHPLTPPPHPLVPLTSCPLKSFVFKCKLELAIKRVRWAGKTLSHAGLYTILILNTLYSY